MIMKPIRTNKLISISLAIVPVSMPDNNTGYLIGAVIAVLVLVYLIYTIARPEKF
jgi:K+-transporting ATPase KdpF subunit